MSDAPASTVRLPIAGQPIPGQPIPGQPIPGPGGAGPALPDSVMAIGEALARPHDIVVPAALFTEHAVLAAETARIFTRPWLAVDHASRLGADCSHFRFDVANRSVVVTRDRAGGLHALRNACLHAGYRICEAEDGEGETLVCTYHDWHYALDGLLIDPVLRPAQEDRSRYRLPRYAVRVVGGLILVDLSQAGPEPQAGGALDADAIPPTLATSRVTRRRRHRTTWNWKTLRQLLWSAPDLVLDGLGTEGGEGRIVELGPLSLLALHPPHAALLRVVPRYPGHSDVEIVRMTEDGAPAPAAHAEDADPVAVALREAGDPSGALDRDFLAWYWSLMAPA
jgi:nitrite reductase/ring-hydroxylating ferredoxin subunit